MARKPVFMVQSIKETGDKNVKTSTQEYAISFEYKPV